jgi:hypothetical protein
MIWLTEQVLRTDPGSAICSILWFLPSMELSPIHLGPLGVTSQFNSPTLKGNSTSTDRSHWGPSTQNLIIWPAYNSTSLYSPVLEPHHLEGSLHFFGYLDSEASWPFDYSFKSHPIRLCVLPATWFWSVQGYHCAESQRARFLHWDSDHPMCFDSPNKVKGCYSSTQP